MGTEMTRQEAKEFLTPREFEAWELKEQGLTPKEIAEKMDVHISNVHTLLRQGKIRLRIGKKPKSSSWVKLEEKLKTPVSSMELVVGYGEDKTAVIELTPKQYKAVIRAIGAEAFDEQIEAYEKGE